MTEQSALVVEPAGESQDGLFTSVIAESEHGAVSLEQGQRRVVELAP